LFTRLEELGVAEDTIVVLTGDHGESLYEHECWFDHHGLYESNLHVPLIVRAPGQLPEAVRIPGYVTHYDLMPTILDLLGDRRVRETGQPDPILQYHLGTEKKIGSVRQARDLQARTEAKAS